VSSPTLPPPPEAVLLRLAWETVASVVRLRAAGESPDSPALRRALRNERQAITRLAKELNSQRRCKSRSKPHARRSGGARR
jgi:hypothetical protein